MKEKHKVLEPLLPLEKGEKAGVYYISKKTIYVVTSLGRVYSIRSKEIKTRANTQRYGYIEFGVSNGEQSKTVKLHRAVAELFIKKEKNKNMINHKDGNKKNNCYSNLEWCTSKENNDHAIKTGLSRKFGKNEGRIKFSDDQVKKVVSLIKKDGYSYSAAGATEGMSYSTVAHIMTGRRRETKGIPKYEKKSN